MAPFRLPVFLLALPLIAQTPPAWVQKSNENAQLLIEISARYSPESAARNGVTGLDEKVTVITPDGPQRARADYAAAKKELESRLAAEKDPLVRQDLQILIEDAEKSIRS